MHATLKLTGNNAYGPTLEIILPVTFCDSFWLDTNCLVAGQPLSAGWGDLSLDSEARELILCPKTVTEGLDLLETTRNQIKDAIACLNTRVDLRVDIPLFLPPVAKN